MNDLNMEGKAGDCLIVDENGNLSWININEDPEYQLYLKLKSKYDSESLSESKVFED